MQLLLSTEHLNTNKGHPRTQLQLMEWMQPCWSSGQAPRWMFSTRRHRTTRTMSSFTYNGTYLGLVHVFYASSSHLCQGLLEVPRTCTQIGLVLHCTLQVIEQWRLTVSPPVSSGCYVKVQPPSREKRLSRPSVVWWRRVRRSLSLCPVVVLTTQSAPPPLPCPAALLFSSHGARNSYTNYTDS